MNIPKNYTLFCTSYYKQFSEDGIKALIQKDRDWLLDIKQDQSGLLWCLKNPEYIPEYLRV